MTAADGAGLAHASPVLWHRRCVRCGEPLTPPFWVVRYPDAVHETCMDWIAHPFPFARAVDVIRILVHRLPPRERAIVDGLRRDLVALAAQWPNAAVDVLRAGRSIVRAARPHLAPLDHRDRQRL